MKTIIAGSRRITDPSLVQKAVGTCGWKITEVVCGEARGVDSLGKIWANNNSIPVASFIPYWGIHGRAAGHIRNAEMAKYADALIAIWDGRSPGTRSMISLAKSHRLRIHVLNIDELKSFINYGT